MSKALAADLSKNQFPLCWYGTFTKHNNHDYYCFAFELPPAITRVRATLRYSDATGNILGLYLYDAYRLRAYGHVENTNDMVEVTAEVTTERHLPGAIPGRLLPGMWLAEITANKVDTICAYQLEIEISSGGQERFVSFEIPPKPEITARKPAGWYRGDFHVHSLESDGTKSVKELLGIAREKGLDFMAITDHNGISNWWELPQKANGVLPLRGMEITTFFGHANALGIEDWIDWRSKRGGRTINDIADEVHDQGGLFSVNHPCTPGLPEGHASWQDKALDWNKVDALEVWNAPVFSLGEEANQQSRKFWDQLLNEGYRIPAIGGSDAHYLPSSLQSLGMPLNYVYAAELSQSAILEAVKDGKVFVTLGPALFFEGINAGGYALPGDRLPEHGGSVSFNAEIQSRKFEGLVLKLVQNGKVIRETTLLKEEEKIHYQIKCRSREWYRLELSQERNGGRMLVAFSNPIYIY